VQLAARGIYKARVKMREGIASREGRRENQLEVGNGKALIVLDHGSQKLLSRSMAT
jgi:hypothetical protein